MTSGALVPFAEKRIIKEKCNEDESNGIILLNNGRIESF